MAMNKSKRTAKRKPVDRYTHMIGAMLSKLEANPHRPYEAVLNAEEYNEAVLMIRAAVAHVQGYMVAQLSSGRRVRPPARFEWRDSKYPLQYSNLGRVFIATPSGTRVIGSGFFAL